VKFEFRWQMDLSDDVKMMLSSRAVEVLKDVWDVVEKFYSREIRFGRSSYGEMMFPIFDDEVISRDRLPDEIRNGDIWLMIPLNKDFDPYIEWMSESMYCKNENEPWCRVLAEIEVRE